MADGSQPQSGFVLKLSAGEVLFPKAEASLYNKLFAIVDQDGDQLVHGKECISLFRRSRLSDEVLSQVWRQASGGRSSAELSRDGFFLAMKLIAQAQQRPDGKVSVPDLIASQPPKAADFGLFGTPDLSQHSPRDVPPGSLSVQVESSETVSSGLLQRHTVYRICSQTTLSLFPRASMVAHRRFSDFTWLHERLSKTFLGTIVPPLPEKKMMGNLDPDFVRERQQALQQFLCQVAEHPLLHSSFDFAVFLDASPEGLEAAKQLQRADEPGLVGSMWGAMSRLRGLGRGSSPESTTASLPAQAKPDETYIRAVEAMAQYETRLQRLTRRTARFIDAQKAVGYEASRAGHYLFEVAEMEREVAPPCAHFDAQAAQTLERAAQTTLDSSDKDRASFLLPLKAHLGRVAGVKTVMANRSEAVRQLENAMTDRRTATRDYAAARASSAGGTVKASSAEAEREEADRRMAAAERNVAIITQSLRGEVQQLQRGKAGDLKALLEQHVHEQIEFARQMRGVWLSLVPSCAGSRQELLDSMERVRAAAQSARVAGGGPRASRASRASGAEGEAE